MERSAVIRLRVTPEEKAQIEKAAKDSPSVSEWIRGVLFNPQVFELESRPTDPPEVVEADSDYAQRFDRRVAELSKTLPKSTARRIATQELG